MNKIKALLIVAIMLLVTGCGTKVPFKAQEPKDGASLLYVYVVDSISDDDSMQDSKFRLRINNKNVAGTIRGGEYKIFDMKPATVLMTAVRKQIEEKHLKLTMEAGKTYFLKVQAASFGEAYEFEEVSMNEGQSGIALTSLAGEVGIDLTAYVPDYAGSTAKNKDGVVAVPAMTEAEIDAMIEKKLSQRVSAPAVPQTVTTPKLSKMEQIEKAYNMKEQGILTEEEFAKVKADILAK